MFLYQSSTHINGKIISFSSIQSTAKEEIICSTQEATQSVWRDGRLRLPYGCRATAVSEAQECLAGPKWLTTCAKLSCGGTQCWHVSQAGRWGISLPSNTQHLTDINSNINKLNNHTLFWLEKKTNSRINNVEVVHYNRAYRDCNGLIYILCKESSWKHKNKTKPKLFGTNIHAEIFKTFLLF